MTSCLAAETRQHEARVTDQAPQPVRGGGLGRQIHRPGREATGGQTDWNRGKGTFVRKSEAQRAIDEAYEIATTPDTLGEYFATWIERPQGPSGPTRPTSTGSPASPT